MSQARIADPGLIRTARRAVLVFGDHVDGELGGVVAGLHRVRDALRCDRLPYWKNQVSRRQEAYHEARRLWLAAEDDVRSSVRQGRLGRASGEDERRAMLKAKARMEEAEEKVATVKRWLARLDDDGDALAERCRNHGRAVRELVDAAALRLDRAAEAVETYLDLSVKPHG